MANILITGANGQLGSELRKIGFSPLDEVFFTDVAELDITDYISPKPETVSGKQPPGRPEPLFPLFAAIVKNPSVRTAVTGFPAGGFFHICVSLWIRPSAAEPVHGAVFSCKRL